MPDLTTLALGGRVHPEWQVASLVAEDVTAQAQVVVGGPGALSSGPILPARLTDAYLFANGTRAELPSVDLGVAVYQYPPLPDTVGTLVGRFPVRPRHLLSPTAGTDIHQQLLLTGALSFTGAPLDILGGVVAHDGLSVFVPAGAMAGPTLISLTRLPAEVAVVDNLSALVSFRVEWSGDLAAGQRLSFDPGPLPPNSDYLLARQEVNAVRTGWVAVERYRTNAAGELISQEPPSGALTGLRTGGHYALFPLDTALGVVRGTVLSGGPAGVVTQIVGEPWLQVTQSAGTYGLVAPVGPVTLTGEVPQSGDTGQNTGTAAVLVLNLNLGAAAPQIVRTEPADNSTGVSVLSAVDIYFSEPVNPISLPASPISVLAKVSRYWAPRRCAPTAAH